MFLVFTGIVFSVGPPGAWSFCFTFLRAALGGRRPPVAPFFAARRKIEEKGVPRGCGPLNPRSNVLGHSDVLCACRLATVHLTRLSRAWRASHCFHELCVLRCSERQQDLCNHPTSDYKLSWLFFKCQRFRRSSCSTIESGGSSAFGNEIAEKRWCLAFRRSRVKRTPPARRRAGLNRVNCTRAHT